ncbi:MAG: polyprenyl synthetase family protein [Candidatus Bathyarchaeota archaeon]|nr:MAG: polyprenyl synthetase family protein [Candidatus Bathyarchaeota archaeon]
MENEIIEKIRNLSPDAFLDYYTEVIDKRLEAYSLRIIAEASCYHPFISKTTKRISEFVCRKCKRIASCSTLLTYLGYVNQVDEAILSVCEAIELFRHSILIHDDLVDMDNLRRGGKAFHKLFSDEYDTRFGKGTAIFYGNILYSEAITMLLKSGFDRSHLLKAVELLSTGYREVNESQVLDLFFESQEPTLKEWEAMASKRAASLFNVNMMMGAILGGVAEKELRLIKDIAKHIGFSFDIQDDIIGTFASAEQYGRPPGGDLILGKKALHIVYAYQLIQGTERGELKNLLTQNELSDQQMERIKEIVKCCGALEKAKQRSKEHAEIAIEALDKTTMNDYSKDFFSYLIYFISESLDWYR